MRKCTLLVDTLSFHKHRLYATWVINFDKQSYGHDNFLVKYNGQKIEINESRVTRVGVQSDYLVIELNMKTKTWRPSKERRKEEQEHHKDQENQNRLQSYEGTPREERSI
jgi:hypothetical protein